MKVPSSLLQHPDVPEFIHGFQEEHLSEAEFLLTQRQSHVRDPEVPWPDIADMERRIEAHVEALWAGGPVALELVRDALASGDEAPLLAAIHILASSMEWMDGLDEVLHTLEEAAEDLLPVWVDALALSEHPRLAERALPLLSSPRSEVRAVAAQLLGRRHEGQGERLLPLLDDASPEVRAAAVIALARLDYRPALSTLEQLLQFVPVSEWEPLTFAALCLGSPRALQHCRQACQAGGEIPSGFPRLLAMAGEERDLPLLQKLCAHSKLASRAVSALGILGVPSSVPFLIEHLSSDALEVRLAAGAALNLLTGACLQVKNRLPAEGADEDEPGREVHLPNTDPTTWNEWWDSHQPRFSGARRYRLGKPFSLALCIEELADPRSPFDARERAAQELRIHSGQAIGFEPDWPIRRQHAAIARWRKWWAEHGSRSVRR